MIHVIRALISPLSVDTFRKIIMIQEDQKVPILGLWFLDTDYSVGPEQVVCMRSDD